MITPDEFLKRVLAAIDDFALGLSHTPRDQQERAIRRFADNVRDGWQETLSPVFPGVDVAGMVDDIVVRVKALFPLVQAACPDHPLLRETRREVLEDCLDAPTARNWLATRPSIRFRSLDGPSPFAAAWIDPGGPEPLRFESPDEALRRLHQRLVPR